MSFDQLGLSKPVLQALAHKGYETPSPIQLQAIPPVLEGRDLLGIAQTGTGKTAAFMLPSIDRLSASDHQPLRRSCRMLVLAPTRELAGQIAQSARDYSAFSGMSVASVVGGTSVHKDRMKLARGTDILVATPGRLLDLIDQGVLVLDGVEILVLDEADQMLDLGFIHALKRIVGLLPHRRQTLFFSATMPPAIAELAGRYLRDPVKVSVTPQATTAERVEQYVILVQYDEKQALLNMVLGGEYAVEGEMDRVLVFTRTKHGADRVVRKLGQAKIAANAIHGNKSQPQREKALAEFRSGRVPILVATDVAARGIDIPGVSHVINYELPNVPEQYVHRIGRTARAGADGVAISFCAEDERAYLRDIQRLTGIQLSRLPLPDNFRAVVEGIGPDKPEPRQPRQKVKVVPRGARPDGEDKARSNPKRKHPSRAGKPRRDGEGQGQRDDRQRHDGQRRDGQRNDGQRQQAHGRDGERREGQRSDGRRGESQRREGQRSEGHRNEGHRGDGNRNANGRNQAQRRGPDNRPGGDRGGNRGGNGGGNGGQRPAQRRGGRDGAPRG
ncbi:MAG: DEAD/DEAH box helicase [Sphingomonadales bacterium]|nr:DEAD/DEAH box helicase [Sphingomonadales bacterium]MBD3774689.1 DEAD/DEAH box helicase [Paracoccaceae bacterium]